MWHTFSARVPTADLPARFEQWLGSVPEDYAPAIRPAREAQIKALALELSPYSSSTEPVARDPYGRPGTVQAEIFRRNQDLFLVSWKPLEGRGRPVVADDGSLIYDETEDRSILRIGYLGTALTPAPLDELVASLTTFFGVDFKPAKPVSRNFRDVAAGAQLSSASDVDELEVAAAKVLSSKVTRQLAIAIKSSSGLLVQNISKSLPDASDGDLASALSLLENAGLTNEEIVVLCSKSSAQVTRVDNRSMLPRISKLGARCACGKKIDEEPAERSLTISELAAGLIDKSRWLSVLICRELMDRGVPADKILLEHTAGGDEVDCLADIFGRLVLFELKDKPFNLGNAYSFGAKIPIFQPDISVVVTTEHVGRDAKEHFARSRESARRGSAIRYDQEERDSPIIYIEGLTELPRRLDEIVTQVQRQRARIQVRDALSIVAIPEFALLDAVSTPVLDRNADDQQPDETPVVSSRSDEEASEE